MNAKSAKTLAIVSTMLLLIWTTTATAVTDSNSTASALAMHEVPLKLGEPFFQARKRIIKLGWKPIQMHQNDEYEYSGIEKELAKRKLFELEGCSIDAGVLCIFYYSKLTRCLRVDTAGEDLARITVTRWTEECPEKNQ